MRPLFLLIALTLTHSAFAQDCSPELASKRALRYLQKEITSGGKAIRFENLRLSSYLDPATDCYRVHFVGDLLTGDFEFPKIVEYLGVVEISSSCELLPTNIPTLPSKAE
jgi:hypothetical protein